MSVRVYVAATLRSFANRHNEITAEGRVVSQVLTNVRDEYPELGQVLFDEGGDLREFISVYCNDRCVNDDLTYVLSEGDVITLIPAMAGGSGSREQTEAASPADSAVTGAGDHADASEQTEAASPTDSAVTGAGDHANASVISDDRRKAVALDDAETERYNKHLMLREVGVKGQKRIKAARVLVIGLGTLGAPVVQYLAAAGVGTIGIADHDKVSVENLQGQVIHGTRDVKRPKTASARDAIRAINPKLNVVVIDEAITPDNVMDLITDYDVVADCTDNYKARYLINDACAELGIPDVYASVYQFEAQISVFDATRGPCLRCLYPAPPPAGLVPTCAEGGTLSPLGGAAGSIQAAEVLKLIIGGGTPLIGRLEYLDLWNSTGRVLKMRKRDNCPICGAGGHLLDVSEYDYDELCGLRESKEEAAVEGIEADELAARIERGDDITIVDVREPHERAIRKFPGAIVIPIGQLARRQKELDPAKDTIFICREGKRSILAINTLREAGYAGPMYNLRGGVESAKNIIFSNEGAWL